MAEFLILSVRDPARVGSTMKIVGAAPTETDAVTALEALDGSIVGRVAIAEVKQVYDRQPTIQSTLVTTDVISST